VSNIGTLEETGANRITGTTISLTLSN
jgi:hypothetical protein